MPTGNITTPPPTCAACGCTSLLARLFRKAGGASVICSRCYVKHSEAQQRKFTVIAMNGNNLAYTLLLDQAAGPDLALIRQKTTAA